MNYPNIAIVSYNIFWELMEESKINNIFDYITGTETKTMRKNMLDNILKVSEYYNPQIYCFQEASNYKLILKLFNQKTFSHHVNKSGREHMLTVWNHERFKLLESFDGEFESGRPFCIFYFQDNLTKNNFILINIHAGHRKDSFTSIFKPIQKILDSNEKKLKNVSRIIVAGDFNRNINGEILEDKTKSTNMLVLNIGTKNFNFNPYDKKMYNTCCDTVGNNLVRNFDHVIDSYQKPLIRHELNKESWYKYPSSDHVLIMSILKKY